MRIIVILDEKTGETWYYILESDKPESVIIDSENIKEKEDDVDSIH